MQTWCKGLFLTCVSIIIRVTLTLGQHCAACFEIGAHAVFMIHPHEVEMRSLRLVIEGSNGNSKYYRIKVTLINAPCFLPKALSL